MLGQKDLHNCSSLKTFEANALEEYSNICSQMKDYIGTGGYPYEPYISHIYTKILTIEKKRDPDDICDYGGYRIVPIKMKKKYDDIYKTIEYVIIPEIFTEFIMEKREVGYKEASLHLYSNALPTKHHIAMLIDDRNVVFSTNIKKNKKHIILQVVKNNIAIERSHVIVNAANKHLLHGGTVALAIAQEGGSLIQNESNEYIKNNGPLNVGDIICVSPGKLQCFYLFHGVTQQWGIDKPEEKLINKTVCDSLLLADKYLCKSISIPAFSCGNFSNGPVSVKKSVTSIIKAILTSTNSLQQLTVIRIVSVDTSTLEHFVKTINSLLKLKPSKIKL